MKTSLRIAIVSAWIALGIAPGSYAQSVLSRVLAGLGITANPGQVRAGDTDTSGDIFLWRSGKDVAQRLTTEGGYRSPVFGRKGEVLALKGNLLVSIPLAGGPARELRTVSGARKLLGVNKDNADELVVLIEQNGVLGLATLALTGAKIIRHPHDPASQQDLALLAALQDDARDYGPVKLYLKTESKRGVTGRTIEWTDVYLKRGDAAPQNVSRCDGSNCAQPALALDGGQVVYIRSTR